MSTLIALAKAAQTDTIHLRGSPWREFCGLPALRLVGY
jgi:hypothetical protein